MAHELRKQINENKNFEITKKINFPDVICSEKDDFVWNLFFKREFFSDKTITTSCITYRDNINDGSLANKIIMIENADPGYDFIFSKKISGLITKYGGANSHMSIRCMEEKLPACIGIGETQFNILKILKLSNWIVIKK